MRNMKNKRGKLITVLFVAAMSVSLLLDWMKVHCLNWHPTQGLLQMS